MAESSFDLLSPLVKARYLPAQEKAATLAQASSSMVALSAAGEDVGRPGLPAHQSPMDYMGRVAHAQAQDQERLKEGETAWEVEDWWEMIRSLAGNSI